VKDDVEMAIQAAQAMASMARQDVAIMPDLSTKLLKDAEQAPLEIIRYNKGERNET